MTVWRSNARAPLVLAGTCLLIAVMASCSARSPHAARSISPAPVPAAPTAAPSSSTSMTAASMQAEAVIEAYQGMWADVVSAARTADYRSPLLAAHTIDPATGQLRRTLLTFDRMGWVAKGTVVTHPEVLSASPGSDHVHAQVMDCLDETHWLTYYAGSGKLTDDKPGQRHQIAALMRHTTDGWTVESFTVAPGGSC